MLLLEGIEELLAAVAMKGAEGRVYPEGYASEKAWYVKAGAENEGTVGYVVVLAAAGCLPSRTIAEAARKILRDVTV